MSYKEVNDKQLPGWPRTARQARRKLGNRKSRKQARKAGRNR